MKFGKLLQDQISEVPDALKPKFLSYKQLKKQLKGTTSPAAAGTEKSGTADATREENGVEPEPAKENGGSACSLSKERENGSLTPDEGVFVSKLNEEIIKFNDYFIKREEELIIRVKDLGDRAEDASDDEERLSLRSVSVHLHGEIILLLHWCELNYIGLVKILKKHDKKTGLLLRSPFLANVVKQPFCSTTILKRLVKQVEDTIIQIVEGEEEGGAGDVQMIHDMADGHGQGAAAESLPQLVITLGDDSEDELDSGAGILKQTRVAINLWQTLQKSKTPGGQQFVPVVEQTRGVRGQKREQGEQGEERQRQKKQRGECACCLKGDCC